jgi:TolB protein
MVTISPAAVTLTGTGQIQQFSAQVFDRNGYPVPDAGLTWTSLQPLVASVDATGLATALANGEATILAQVGTAEATAVITVDIPSLIVFRSDHEGNWDLYSILSDGTNLRRLTQTTSAESEPAVSADGRSIAYTNNDDIWLMDIDGANPRQLTSSPVGARGPSWSPDGTRMAISYRVEAYYWPYALTVANGSLSQLVMGNTAHSELSWSHGSPVIAARYGVGSIAVFGVEQGESTVLASMHSVARPRFSPDGSRIAFGGQETDTSWWDIYVMDADGRNLTRYATATNDNHPTWSPDGRKIAFWRDGALWVMNADGTGATRLTYFTTGQIVEPSWYN